jgi:pantoate--beta-alanine ligase|tara:strand:+ start:2911 stop:3720 length:810 start_codon:yes stop_codon:yes gene_type:complete
MKIIESKNKLIKFIDKEKKLGFIPTMGAIHQGHISLIKRAAQECTKTIVSIFVNKPQFNKKSDFISYPRTLSKDISVLKKNKVSYLYIPKFNEIYPRGYNKNIKISSFKERLCGKFRPGHFESVVDVIDRFIRIIKPKRIYLGNKDMQQLKIVEEFIKRKHNDTKVIGCKTVREKNGIALSSRNLLLTRKEKIIASKIYKLLIKNKKKLINDKNYLKLIRKIIFKLGVKKIDYIEIVDINKITKPFVKKKKFKVFVAYYLGKIRLIDNV